ncbi:MAG: hypothetical protein LBH24_06410 [Clostridiales bacterium]|jgi:hypothetical protein|nr:hypothetical protein [Clostridiales bacterium]
MKIFTKKSVLLLTAALLLGLLYLVGCAAGSDIKADLEADHPSVLRGYEASGGPISFYSRMAAFEMDRPGNVVVRVDIDGTFESADVSYRSIPKKQVRYKNGKLVIDKEFFTVFQSPIDRVLNVHTKEGATASIPLMVANKVIMTVDEFVAINEDPTSLDGKYVLGADLDLSDKKSFEMIGLKVDEFGNEQEWSFTGTLDGGGHMISNLTIDRGFDGSPNNEKGYKVGLFKRIGTTGIVRNLRVSNFDITAIGIGGALAGINEGTLSNCIVINSQIKSKADGNEPSGALAGFNADKAVVKNCIAQAKLTNVFTLIGGNFGAVTDCAGIPLADSIVPRLGGYIRVGVEDWKPEGFLVESDYLVNMGEGTAQRTQTLEPEAYKQMENFTAFDDFIWNKAEGTGITLRKLSIPNRPAAG